MLKTKITQKNYTVSKSGYQLKLPLEFNPIIPENDSVRLVSQFVEEMDLTELYQIYDKIRKSSAVPKTLLKIVITEDIAQDSHLCNYEPPLFLT